mgnify:CR=1 FL=1
MSSLKTQIIGWLRDQKRSYAVGVSLFRSAASRELTSKYMAFFEGVENPPVSDIHFTMLINKLSSISQWVADDATVEEAQPVTEPAPAGSGVSKKKAAASPAPKAQDTPVESSQDPTKVDPAKLSEKQKAALERIKEIVPVMANLHTKMKSASISNADRASLAKELDDLEDERASLWDIIDGSKVEAQPKGEAPDKELTTEQAAILVLKQRAGQLRWNITRSERAAQDNKSEKARQNASARVAEYQAKLKEVLEKLAAYGITD